jgi:hypothetical protein
MTLFANIHRAVVPSTRPVAVTFQQMQRAFSNTALRQRSIKSLALSVYFKQPELGMKDYEILSRASAFLLAVDPRPDNIDSDDQYAHLERNQKERQLKLHKQRSRYTPAGQPGDNRELTELGWLEYAPREVRPTVHCVCSSHVLAPFLWKDCYPQDWLNKVRQEHWYDSTQTSEISSSCYFDHSLNAFISLREQCLFAGSFRYEKS